MTCPSVVRVARPEDRQEVWRLLLQGHRENGIFPLAPEKVDWIVNRALQPELIPAWDTGPRGVIGVIGPVGSLEALVLTMLGEYWYTRHKNIDEYLVYTDPECRRSRHAHALHEWMQEQVERAQIPMITGVISNDRTEAKCRLYRQKFQKIGEFFFIGPKGFSFPVTATSS